MNLKKRVLLVTEGTYPFSGGGVSTWSHHLIQNIDAYDFSIYAMNADVVSKPKFELGDAVKEVLQVPMWAPEEPFDCVDYNQDYSEILKRKELTTEKEIKRFFLPSFRDFLLCTFSNQSTRSDNPPNLLNALKKMWEFFDHYDYKTTLVSELVWSCFKDTLNEIWPEEELEHSKLIDLTMALRLLYRYLIPLAIKVPESQVTHLTIAGIGIIPALKQKIKKGSPIVLTEHGVFIRERMIAINNSDFSPFLKKVLILFSESFTRLTYAYSDQIISVSKFNVIWEKRYGANPSKIKVIYNGVDHNVFLPRKEAYSHKIPTVVAAARIFELKDIITMIKSCAYVREHIPNVRFLIYGNKDAVPEYTKECEDLIEKLELKDNFSLAGFHDNPSKLYLEGDISILTSISEGFPFTVIESMSCGVPIVATDVGGVSEAIKDGETGFICKPKDYNAIGKRVVELLQDERLRTQIGVNAREKVLESFTIEKFTSAFSEVYDGALKESARHGSEAPKPYKNKESRSNERLAI